MITHVLKNMDKFVENAPNYWKGTRNKDIFLHEKVNKITKITFKKAQIYLNNSSKQLHLITDNVL